MTIPGLIPEAGVSASLAFARARKSWVSAECAALHRLHVQRTIEATGGGDFKVFFDALLADYYRLAKPSFASAYRRAVATAKHKAQAVPSVSTARRILGAIENQTKGAS